MKTIQLHITLDRNGAWSYRTDKLITSAPLEVQADYFENELLQQTHRICNELLTFLNEDSKVAVKLHLKGFDEYQEEDIRNECNKYINQTLKKDCDVFLVQPARQEVKEKALEGKRMPAKSIGFFTNQYNQFQQKTTADKIQTASLGVVIAGGIGMALCIGLGGPAGLLAACGIVMLVAAVTYFAAAISDNKIDPAHLSLGIPRL